MLQGAWPISSRDNWSKNPWISKAKYQTVGNALTAGNAAGSEISVRPFRDAPVMYGE
jgi:hypothetical protein